MLSMGLIAALRESGSAIAPFKKGPDYIDAGWLALAAGRPCHNLDTFLQDREQVRFSFFRNALEGEVSTDEVRRGEARLQELTDSHIAKIDQLVQRKETELLEV